jgi:hypothetical protein
MQPNCCLQTLSGLNPVTQPECQQFKGGIRSVFLICAAHVVPTLTLTNGQMVVSGFTFPDTTDNKFAQFYLEKDLSTATSTPSLSDANVVTFAAVINMVYKGIFPDLRNELNKLGKQMLNAVVEDNIMERGGITQPHGQLWYMGSLYAEEAAGRLKLDGGSLNWGTVRTDTPQMAVQLTASDMEDFPLPVTMTWTQFAALCKSAV